MDEDAGRPCRGRRFPPGFEVRVVTIPPGGRRAHDDAWRDALVIVDQGEVELEQRSGCRCRFLRGDLLWLDGLALEALHNRGREPAVLVAVARRPSARRP